MSKSLHVRFSFNKINISHKSINQLRKFIKYSQKRRRHQWSVSYKFHLTEVVLHQFAEEDRHKLGVRGQILSTEQLQTNVNNYQTSLCVIGGFLRGKVALKPMGQDNKEWSASKVDEYSFSPQTHVCSKRAAISLNCPFWPLQTETTWDMSNLKEICSGLPLDPLPPHQGRDPNLPHAPVRTPNLTAQEERVSRNTH